MMRQPSTNHAPLQAPHGAMRTRDREPRSPHISSVSAPPWRSRLGCSELAAPNTRLRIQLARRSPPPFSGGHRRPVLRQGTDAAVLRQGIDAAVLRQGIDATVLGRTSTPPAAAARSAALAAAISVCGARRSAKGAITRATAAVRDVQDLHAR